MNLNRGNVRELRRNSFQKFNKELCVILPSQIIHEWIYYGMFLSFVLFNFEKKLIGKNINKEFKELHILVKDIKSYCMPIIYSFIFYYSSTAIFRFRSSNFACSCQFVCIDFSILHL